MTAQNGDDISGNHAYGDDGGRVSGNCQDEHLFLEVAQKSSMSSMSSPTGGETMSQEQLIEQLDMLYGWLVAKEKRDPFGMSYAETRLQVLLGIFKGRIVPDAA